MVSTFSISFLGSSLGLISKEYGALAEVGQFWTPISPISGSLLHADSHSLSDGGLSRARCSAAGMGFSGCPASVARRSRMKKGE